MIEQDDENDIVIRGRDSVLKYAKKYGMKDKDIRKNLLVLHPDNDPFYIPQPWQEKHAIWFAKVFKQRAEETVDDKANPRGIHYYAYSKDLKDWDGKPYLNEQILSKRTTDASKFVRYMDIIDYEAIIDAKNPPPRIHRNYGRLKYNIDTDDKEILLPNIKYDDGTYRKIDIDKWVRSEAEKYNEIITADTGIYSDDIQPFHTEMFIEKTDHDRILDPICAKYLTNYQAFKGEGSLTAAHSLIKRIKHVDKPIRVFYISDFDGKGEHMPTAFARKVEKLVRSKPEYEGKDIKLKPIALLPWQVKKYKLPRRPIKDSDKSKKKFEKKHGTGAVELDALEGVCPGEFKKIVENELKRYYDPDIVKAAYEKIDEVNSEIHNRVMTALKDESLLEEIRNLNDLIDQHEEIEAPYQNSIDELNDELVRKREELKAPYLAKIKAIEEEMDAECKKLEAPYSARVKEIEYEMADATDSIEAEIDEQYQDILGTLPDIDLSDIDEDFVKPESDVSPTESEEWLYDSSLSYFDQLKRYKNVATIENDDGEAS